MYPPLWWAGFHENPRAKLHPGGAWLLSSGQLINSRCRLPASGQEAVMLVAFVKLVRFVALECRRKTYEKHMKTPPQLMQQ